MTTTNIASPVVVSLTDLRENKIEFTTLEQAFGDESDSLGIILVKDLPPEYHELRIKVLRQASILAALPIEELNKLENEEAYWLIGWSLGKEKLKHNKPDLLKGSYYINCSFYKDWTKEGPTKEETMGYEHMKSYTAPNLWPSSDLLPDFVNDCKKLIKLIIDVSIEVAKNCDRYCENKLNGNGNDYEAGYLKRLVESSYTTKARLLHYYPKPVGKGQGQGQDPGQDNEDDWCGEHLDHSCLTGLTGALFINETTNEIIPSSNINDPNSGLFIKNRHDTVYKVNIPIDCLAFQTGSCLQEVSNNKFKAVPHYVKNGKTSSDNNNVARNTLAVFVQPSLHEKVNKDEDFAQYCQRILANNH